VARQLGAVPLRLAQGSSRLLELESGARRLLEEEGSEAGGEMEAVLPQEGDLNGLSDLLLEGFRRVLEPKLLREDQLGPLASLWNSCVFAIERQTVRIGLVQNLQRVLLRPSVQLPPGRSFEGHGLGLMLLPRGRSGGPPAAFCELCLLPNDGRKVDDMAEVMSMLSVEQLDDTAEPYLLNFCVAGEFRRRGVGRALLRLAEDIVQEVWGRQCLYLHADDDEAATGFYRSAGYELVAGSRPADKGQPAHMCKQLAPRSVASAAPAQPQPVA